jgi:hypothetical protein
MVISFYRGFETKRLIMDEDRLLDYGYTWAIRLIFGYNL